MHAQRWALLVLTVVLQATTGVAQVAWTRPSLLTPRANHALAYDAARGRVVQFGGMNNMLFDDTWTFDGTRWELRAPVNRPVPRLDHALAYDAGRGRVVLFGGNPLGLSLWLNDTWEWDGSNWTQRTPSVSPPGMDHHAMTYDAGRGRVVLFGGLSSAMTWEWDGSNWAQRTPGLQPSTRDDSAMAYDPVRGRVVLFGGEFLYTYYGDTWEWDGTSWTQRAPVLSPPGRSGHGLVWDPVRGRVVLFGGYTSFGGAANDTWEWDGSTWAQRLPAVAPPARAFCGLAFDTQRGQAVTFGGSGSSNLLGDTWQWDGSNWSVVPGPAQAVGNAGEALTWDPTRAKVLRASTNQPMETWEYDAAGWQQRFPATTPLWRAFAALAFDRVRGRAVLFGGTQVFNALADTWEWDGSNWALISQRLPPPPRAYAGMVFDDARGRTLLFGGGVGDFLFSAPVVTRNDTWLWDGSVWRQLLPATSPTPRVAHGLAYDRRRAVAVLFGGLALNGTELGDTWEWDGTTWRQRTSVHAPPPRSFFGMTYDPARDRVVVFGGGRTYPWLNDTWEWDGSDWTQRTTPASPTGRRFHAMAHDELRGRSVVFGGANDSDLWEYGPVQPAAFVPFGHGCAGSAGTPRLHQLGLGPWLGDALSVRVEQLPTLAPALLFLGFSAGSWGAVPLPLPLDALGLTGCTLYTGIEVPLALANQGGFADAALPVPARPDLLGYSAWLQALVVDPPANPFGATLTQGAGFRVGGR